MKNKFLNLTPVQKVTLNYILALLPLILYAFYKNGIIPYGKDYIGLFNLLKPIILPILGFSLGIVVEMIFSIENKKINYTFLKNSFLPLQGLIFSCIVNPNINYLLFTIVLFIGLIITKFIFRTKAFSFSSVAFIKLLLAIVMLMFFNNSYANIYESNIPQIYSNIEIIFGRNIGGMASTSIFLCLMGYLFLYFTKLYKKDIPIYMIASFGMLAIIFAVLNGNINDFFNYISSNSFIFAAVFIVPDTISAPYTKKGRIVYGILLGIFSFLALIFLSWVEGVFIAILICSFLVKIIDKFFALK